MSKAVTIFGLHAVRAALAAHPDSVLEVFVGAGDSVGEQDPLVEISRPEMTTL